jgi:hypothetical protein
MRSWATIPVLLLALAGTGCASPESSKPDATLAAYVLTSVPADIQNTTLVDFGGAVHLVGWDLDPKDTAQPGSSLRLKLYWRSVKKLSNGWKLFTHIVAPDAPKPYAFDAVGPLREMVPDATYGTKQKLSPSDWVPGMIYVDEQTIKVPDVTAAEVTLTVGLYREAMQVVGREVDGLSALRLPILSGLSDGNDRAVIARLGTGVDLSQKRAAKDRKLKSKEGRPGGLERPSRNPRDLPRPGARPAPMAPKETP